MQKKNLPIPKIFYYLSDPEGEGAGFWSPTIQRPLVWREGQNYQLFDSIMRQYPIRAFFVLMAREVVKHRGFIEARKHLIVKNSNYMLRTASGVTP